MLPQRPWGPAVRAHARLRRRRMLPERVGPHFPYIDETPHRLPTLDRRWPPEQQSNQPQPVIYPGTGLHFHRRRRLEQKPQPRGRELLGIRCVRKEREHGRKGWRNLLLPLQTVRSHISGLPFSCALATNDRGRSPGGEELSPRAPRGGSGSTPGFSSPETSAGRCSFYLPAGVPAPPRSPPRHEFSLLRVPPAREDALP